MARVITLRKDDICFRIESSNPSLVAVEGIMKIGKIQGATAPVSTLEIS
jgi:hypothetical protein